MNEILKKHYSILPYFSENSSSLDEILYG